MTYNDNYILTFEAKSSRHVWRFKHFQGKFTILARGGGLAGKALTGARQSCCVDLVVDWMVSFESWAQRDREFRFLIERHFPNESGEAVSLVLTCPKFHEAPIIAALTGFEAVCGYPSGAFIGKNCRFMNRGLPNNKENMSELRAIQSSRESAREFMAKNPKGKQYLLRNKRPARMSERENVTGRTPYTPMPSNDILEALLFVYYQSYDISPFCQCRSCHI